jgi:hypothetical protein
MLKKSYSLFLNNKILFLYSIIFIVINIYSFILNTLNIKINEIISIFLSLLSFLIYLFFEIQYLILVDIISFNKQVNIFEIITESKKLYIKYLKANLKMIFIPTIIIFITIIFLVVIYFILKNYINLIQDIKVYYKISTIIIIIEFLIIFPKYFLIPVISLFKEDSINYYNYNKILSKNNYLISFFTYFLFFITILFPPIFVSFIFEYNIITNIFCTTYYIIGSILFRCPFLNLLYLLFKKLDEKY